MTETMQKTQPTADKQQLIDELNESLAHEYTAVITYRTYASQVQGPWRTSLRDFFAGEIADELGHAELLADKVVALGGRPVTEPKPVKSAGSAREMLENALADERATVERYHDQRRHAEALGEYGLAVDLDDLIADETKHRDAIEMILADWE